MENYFCVHHKNSQKYNQRFKLLFFKLNSHFRPSDLIHICRKLNLLLINSVYLVVSSLYKQRRLIQTKVHFKFFYPVQIEMTHKASKEAAAKNFFSSVYVIDVTSFDECFLSHVMNERR